MLLLQFILIFIILAPIVGIFIWLGRYKAFWQFLAVLVFVPIGVFVVCGALFVLLLTL